MPRRQFRPVRRRRRTPGPLAWAGFAGGITMGALAATLITGSNERPPPQTTQLASGELPEALKSLVAEYLAEEGYRPAPDAGGEPVPPPGSPELAPADVPAPAPVPAAAVPVAPVSTRGGSSLWPIEFIPEPLTPPKPPLPLTVAAQPVDTVRAAVDAVPDALRATDAEPPHRDAGPAPVTPLMNDQPEPDTSLVEAPAPEIAESSVAEVGAGDIVVVPEPEPAKPKKEKKPVKGHHVDGATLVEAGSVAG